MKAKTSSYHGYRFPSEIISHAVWLYYRFCLIFRDVEDLLAERGVIVYYETIRQPSRKFGAEYARKLKPNDSCRSRESSRISLGSDGICLGQPTTGCC